MNARPSPNWELPIEEQIDRIHTFLAPKPDLRDAYDVLIARLDIAANKRAVEEFKEAGEYAGLRQQLDCAYWIFQRMEAAFQLGLHKGERLNILDLNMRGGQFAFVCQAFGHRVQGLDSNHVVYKRIGEILGIERIEYPIRYREFIPPFRQKFDLITALQGQFDYISGGTYWEIADWEWFLHYLIATHCQAPGRIHFTLIRGVNPTTGETLPKDAPAAAFSRFGGTSDAASGVMHLSFDEALLERIRSGGGRRPNLSRVNAESAADAAAPPN